MTGKNPYTGERTIENLIPDPSLPQPKTDNAESHQHRIQQLGVPEPEQNVIIDWADHIHQTKAYNTYDAYFYDFLEFAEWLDSKPYDTQLTEIHSGAVADYMQQLSGGEYTKQNKYYAVKSFYNYLERFDDVDCDPFDGLTPSNFFDWETEGKRNKHEPDRQARYVSKKEKEKLWENVPNPRTRNRLIIDLLWQCGLRQSEIVELRVGDVNLEDRKLSVYAPKTDDTRPVWYQENLDKRMRKWKHAHRDSYSAAGASDKLFVSHVAEKLEPTRINKIVKQAAENAGIQTVVYEDDHDEGKTGLESVDENTTWKRYRFTAHKLRRGYAVRFLKNGGDIKRLSELMGHSNLEQTEHYLDLLEEDKRDAQIEYGPR